MKRKAKKLEKLKDNIEADRINAAALFVAIDEELNSLSTGELTGETGLRLALTMDALLSAERLLKKAGELLCEI